MYIFVSSGTTLEVDFFASEDGGVVDLFLDGAPWKTIDIASSNADANANANTTEQCQAQSVVSVGLTQAPHTVLVVAKTSAWLSSFL